MNELIKPLQAALGLVADGKRGPVTTAAILEAADDGRLSVIEPPKTVPEPKTPVIPAGDQVFARALEAVLKHEGGYVNHPKDPGGATNRGVTFATLRMVGIDVDGDGDVDLADLKGLRQQDLERIYRLFYWNPVKGDLLPPGLNYAMFDYAVNSGPSRAAKELQRILRVEDDGDIGPRTLAALQGLSARSLVNALCDRRLAFMRSLSTWSTFGRGWQRRVDEVRAAALSMTTN